MSQRILIIDDDADILSLVKIVLADEGYEVVTAPNGHAGLAHVEASNPNLIFVDLSMPVMDGWEFVRALRAARMAPGVPVVLMSANSPAGEKTRQLAIDGHLAKPFDLDHLVALARRYLPAPVSG